MSEATRSDRKRRSWISRCPLRLLRLEHGLRLVDLAEKVGLSLSAVHSYEMGHHRPTEETYKRLARIYKKTWGELDQEMSRWLTEPDAA